MRIGCVRSEKFRCHFVAWTFALIAPVRPFWTEFRAVMKRCQMHPNIMKRTKTWVWGPMVWISWVCSVKFRRDFMAWTFVLIVPVRPVLDCWRSLAPQFMYRKRTDRGSFSLRVLLVLLSAPICIPQAHSSCSFSLRVFPQGLSIHGLTKNYLMFSI